MIVKSIVGCVVLAAIFSMSADVAPPQDAKGQDPEEIAKMMALYAKAATPGEEHKGLAAMAGKWELKGEGVMGSFTGTMECRSILGGRYVVCEGRMKVPAGPETMEIQTYEVIGYDNVTKQFQMIWTDSMSTGMWFAPGTPDASGKKITYEAPTKDAITPEGRPFRVVVTLDSPDKHTVELWDSKADKKTLVKEATITETRVK